MYFGKFGTGVIFFIPIISLTFKIDNAYSSWLSSKLKYSLIIFVMLYEFSNIDKLLKLSSFNILSPPD